MGWFEFWPFALVVMTVIVFGSSRGLELGKVITLSGIGLLLSISASVGAWLHVGTGAYICLAVSTMLAVAFGRLASIWRVSNASRGDQKG